MRLEKCTDVELELVEAAKAVLRARRRPSMNTVCAGILVGDGTMHFGLDVVSRKSSVCAEPTVIARAHLDGEYEIVSIGAVCFTPTLQDIRVISPCGACRELIWYHCPRARVLVPSDPDPRAVYAEDLFTFGDLFPQ